MKSYSQEKFHEIEKSFHDDLAETIGDPLKEIDVWELESWEYIMSIIGDNGNKKILDVGCGFGRESIILAKKGALVTGIDISDKSIKVAREMATSEKVHNIDFKVLNVDELDYHNEFDIIFCRASLHHFQDVASVIEILYNSLKNKGIIIAQEPKSENPIAIVGRKFFNPSTPTEHPFRTGELENIFIKIFGNAHVEYFNLVSPLCLIFGQIKCLNSRILKNSMYKLLNPIDKLLLSHNQMQKYSWLEIIWSIKME